MIISHLTIYRASAGSGKTYTLAAEYIRLLLLSPNYHRRVLAVTFTNKATEEMKSRIVRELHRMANREDEVYISAIARVTGMHENDLSAAAAKALAHLLHDYSHFSIVTIDSFFQKVIRAFAHEMGLYAGYNVELDQDSILDRSTGLMLNDIDSNHFLKDWLVEWAKRKIEEGRSWNFKTDMLRLGSEIFSEELQNMDTELLYETTSRKELERFRVKLQQLSSSYWDYLQRCAQRAVSLMDRYGLEVDCFTQKSRGVGGYFLRFAKRQEKNIALPNTYVMQAHESIDAWHSKSSPHKGAIVAAYEAGLGGILHDMIAYQTEHARKVITAGVILKQINVLGILYDLMRCVNEYARDQNLFMLSEASGFLKTIIASADAPFIYERVGSFYNHFMIDEFQDTSSIQWDNFHPLIAGSVSQGYSDWIVGDVKQSIYRWRNTDWKILSSGVEHTLGAHSVQVQNLDRNWRSAPEVVHFNNAFFREAVLQMCAAFLSDEEDAADAEYLHSLAIEITEAYSDSYQHLPDHLHEEKGCVHLEIITGSDDADETWRDTALAQLPQRLEQLQDLGYALSDIAIIVRENKEAQDIADMLLKYRQQHPESKYRYDVLSNESLLVGNAPAVKWLVAAMRCMVDPDDMINRAYLQHEFETYLSPSLSRQANSETASRDSADEHSAPFRIDTAMEKHLSVYEQAEQLILQYRLYQNTEQAPFLQAFQDILLQYTHSEAADIRSFLDWWESKKNRKYVQMPDSQDAIRLITIHKSKGLEFDAVIIPFCSWPLCRSGKTLWCRPAEEPFSDMKLLPMTFGQELRNTIFVKEYLREKMMSYIDSLNLLYVAFTRARKALFISTPQQTKDTFVDVRDMLHRMFHHPLSAAMSLQREADSKRHYIRLNDGWQPSIPCFTLGSPAAKKQAKEQAQTEQSSFPVRRLSPPTPYITRSKAWFAASGTHGAQIDRGRLLHEIFRSILTVDDVERCLNTAITEGKLSEADRAHVLSAVHQALHNPAVSQWFARGIHVKTEAEILLRDGTTARPDRVIFDRRGQAQVIDYKFGSIKSGTYRQQVRRYMEHLRSMGYPSVKGFLWYVSLSEVEEVAA